MSDDRRRAIRLIYKKLYSCFGPQNWWPAQTAFEVVVGAILTQGTNWANVEKALGQLKINKVLTAKKLQGLPANTLSKLIRSAGYQNVKAARLKAFLKYLFTVHSGSLKQMGLAATGLLRQELLQVHGIGPETADSILLYALGRPVFVVDAYTRRMLTRHRLIPEPFTYAQIQNLFMQNLKNEVKLFNEYHALLVKLGKEFCVKTNPKCHSCPLKSLKSSSS